MRKQLLQGLATFGILLTLTVASAQAQTGYQITANIPFDFSAGETSLRAGIYSIKLISQDTLLVRSIDGKKSVLLQARQAEPGGTKKPTRIIFNRYGDHYFLSQAWVSGMVIGQQVNPSRVERHLAREYRLAKSNSKPQKVEVAVR